MLIALAETNLCDGPLRETGKNCGPEDFAVGGKTMSQPISAIRAAASTVYGRGNLLTTVAFKISRHFGSVSDAAVWAATYPGSVVRAGTLTVTEGATSKTMANASLEDVQCRHIGASVFVSYRILGGVLS